MSFNVFTIKENSFPEKDKVKIKQNIKEFCKSIKREVPVLHEPFSIHGPSPETDDYSPIPCTVLNKLLWDKKTTACGG
jgi:hypothetical protein